VKAWWGRLSLRARLAGAFALLAAGALVFLLAIIARTLGVDALFQGKIAPAAVFVLAVFVLGGWLLAGWCLSEISELGARINEKPPRPLPAELQGLAALLRREAQKRDRLLEELRRFTADASHELRTPLTALRTVGEVALRDDSASPEALREAIGSMLEETQRMNALVERLLRLARVESEGLPVHARAIQLSLHLLSWRDAVVILAEERDVSLRIECPRDLAVAADAELLGHAVVNLIHNAIAHSPPGGAVTISAHETATVVEIEVADQGPGIASEHHARLFERFYRVDAARSREDGGFGLGLCIAKTAVERMGGAISVQSVPGHGSAFRIRLPRPPSTHLAESSGAST
jgi:signal transduction histidine kinase